MKKCVCSLLILLALTAPVYAADSIAIGVRAGAAVGEKSYNTEAFADLYLNRLISIGATIGYTMVDSHRYTVARDTAVPITALFKLHLPTPVLKPYAGLGQALIFHDKRGTKGSPVGLIGIDIPFGPLPLFLNGEYRRQFDDKLDFLAGGIGVSF